MSVASEQAYELRGPSKVEEAHTCGILCTVFGLSLLDMTTPEARPIVRLLDGMGSALRFTLDHPLNHLSVIGQTTATLCAVSFVPAETHSAPLMKPPLSLLCRAGCVRTGLWQG